MFQSMEHINNATNKTFYWIGCCVPAESQEWIDDYWNNKYNLTNKEKAWTYWIFPLQFGFLMLSLFNLVGTLLFNIICHIIFPILIPLLGLEEVLRSLSIYRKYLYIFVHYTIYKICHLIFGIFLSIYYSTQKDNNTATSIV